MSLKIVTGGTTGAADGTLVSSGNKIPFAAVDTVVNCHLRCDTDTYSADSTVTLPSDGDIEISFDGGSTWKDNADNPIPVVTGFGTIGVDIGDVNCPIKLRQHASTASTSGTFTTDGTFTAATALDTVTGFTATGGSSQVALAWSAVANRTAYQIDRATDSGFTTGVALDISPGQTGTSFTNTGLTSGATYYYRIKAIGEIRYANSASYATANAVASVAAQAAILALSPLRYFPMQEASGTTIDDIGSVNVDATLAGTATVNQSGPGSQKAILFDATGEKITAANDSNVRFTGTASFTVLAWVYLNSSSAFRALFGQDEEVSGNGFKGWEVYLETDDKISLGRYNHGNSPAYDVTTSASGVPENAWKMIAITYDGSNAKFYIDAALDATRATTYAIEANTTRKLRFGNYDQADTNPIQGYMCHFAIFGSALSQADLQSIFDAGY